MSAIQPTAQRHTLIRITARKTYHAAIRSETGWKTACGETITTGPLGVAVTVYSPEEAGLILTTEPERACKRCDRVGSVLL